MRRIYLLVAAALFVLGGIPSTAQAQGQRCFADVPGITHCIEGRFREYWEQNGGLAVFGYPISAATQQTSSEGTFLTQVFERNSFELHPEKARPYDVLLGRLGDVRLKQQGRNWETLPKGQPAGGCLWFPQTGHSVCEVFKTYWEGHGLQDPALDRYGRSLALFGLPLSQPAMETNAAGANVLTQWFERGRFEFHPNNSPEYRVLLGLLGRETSTNGGTPNPTPAPDPGAQCANIGTPVDASIEPNCVKYGEEINVLTFGWDPGQPLGYWVTDQNGTTVGTAQTVNADGEGRFEGVIDTTDWFGFELRPGNYNFVVSDARNVSPGEKYQDSVAPFRVLP
jgi:hypothetical protein